jgi:hypothetical protein
LGDGNRIVNKSTSALYRDSEGRTRREQTLKSIGPLGNGGEPLQTIFINDPVAGVSFALDSRTHTARKSAPFRLERMPLPATAPGAAPGAPEGARFKVNVEPAKVEGGYVTAQAGQMSGPPRPAAPGAEGGQFNIRTEGGVAGSSTFVFTRTPNGADKHAVTESLGKQLFEGVEAEGTRTTITIPAGEVGNERPLEIVNERWYSPELQMVIMSRHSDPRAGETVYRLTNISRTEPASSLFEVPGDYTVKEGMAAPAAPAVYMRKPGSPD